MRTIGFNVDSPATASRQKMTPTCDLHITVTCGWVLKEKKTPQIANLQQIVWRPLELKRYAERCFWF